MKKIVFIWAVLFSAIVVQAASYSYLVFTNTSGTATVLSISGLTMKVDDSSLKVTNSDGSTSFVLTELATMQFSDTDTATGIDNVLNADQPISVYSITGTNLGSYPSLIEASKALGQGSYVISNGNNTQTIVVK